MSKDIKNQIKEILLRPYHWVLFHEEDCNPRTHACWCAYIEEFKGCVTCGDTKEQALANLQDAAESRLECTLEQPELTIPDPIPDYDERTGYSINCRVKHFKNDKLVGEAK